MYVASMQVMDRDSNSGSSYHHKTLNTAQTICFKVYTLVNHPLYLYSLLFSPPSPLQPLFKKMELMEACRYGLVEQVHYFIKTGVNVNMVDFVSCVSTCEGRIMYINGRCMDVYCQNVGKIQSWDEL